MPTYVAGTLRGVRPMGDWSMATARLSPCHPSRPLYASGASVCSFSFVRRARSSTFSTRVLLPAPLTPATHTKRPSGTFTVVRCRLCPSAPFSVSMSAPLTGRLRAPSPTGTRSARAVGPSPVSTRVASPADTTRPPPLPPPGPRSTTKSAARITSASCSTTSTLAPRCTSARIAPMSLPVSRPCRPMVGSSSTYSTPVSPAPICAARRSRCISPPERVLARRSSVR
jgi:hypothetical protein